MSKDKAAPEEAPAPQTAPPGGGGITSESYAEGAALVDDAQKAADQQAAAHLNVEAAEYSEEVRGREADEAAKAAKDEADARKKAASEATAAANQTPSTEG